MGTKINDIIFQLLSIITRFLFLLFVYYCPLFAKMLYLSLEWFGFDIVEKNAGTEKWEDDKRTIFMRTLGKPIKIYCYIFYDFNSVWWGLVASPSSPSLATSIRRTTTRDGIQEVFNLRYNVDCWNKRM